MGAARFSTCSKKRASSICEVALAGSQLVFRGSRNLAVADDHSALRCQLAAPFDQPRRRFADCTRPCRTRELVDWVLDRIDQPEPFVAEARKHGRLVMHVDVALCAVERLRDAA